MLISSLYQRQPRKMSVSTRRIAKERMRHKLMLASFVPAVRLVKKSK